MILTAMARLLILLTTLAALKADITMRYSMDIVPGGLFPPELSAMMKEQMKKSAPELFDLDIVYCYKDDGRTYTRSGGTVILFDPSLMQQTIIFPAGRVYTRTSLADWDKQQAGAAAEAEKLFMTGIEIESEPSQQTKKINGIETEEKVVKMTLDMSGTATNRPGMNPAMGAALGKWVLRMSFWTPLSSEVERMPILSRMQELQQLGQARFNLVEQIVKAFGSKPQLAARMTTMFYELNKGSNFLELRVEQRAPGLVEQLASLRKLKEPDYKPNPDESLMTLVLTVKELGEGAVAESLFEIDKSYKEVKTEEILQIMTKSGGDAPTDKKSEAPKAEGQK